MAPVEPVPSDLNWCEELRLLAFDTHTVDGAPGAAASPLAIGVRLSRHPNRGITDAAVTVSVDGIQTSLHASTRLDPGTEAFGAGPVVGTTDRAGVACRVDIAATELGLTGSLEFSSASAPLTVPLTELAGPPLAGRRRRMHHVGTVRATIALDGVPVVEAASLACVHTHTTGTHARIELEREGAVAPRREPPQRFWHAVVGWHGSAPTLLAAEVDEDDTGRVRSRSDARPADLSPGAVAPRVSGVSLTPGTRWPAAIELDLGEERVTATTVARLSMAGLGEHHAHWVPGRWHDEEAVGIERHVVRDLAACDLRSLHVASLVRADLGEVPFWGIAESLVLGPHQPSGLRGFADPAPSSRSRS